MSDLNNRAAAAATKLIAAMPEEEELAVETMLFLVSAVLVTHQADRPAFYADVEKRSSHMETLEASGKVPPLRRAN